MSVSMNVLLRVNRMKRGMPFSISGFYSLGSHTSVQKALSRLASEGVVDRVAKGFYARPKPLPSIPSIKISASAEQVAKSWAKENNYKLVSQGEEAAYRLGFQTQAPMKSIYWTNGPSRQFKIGNEVVEVRHITEKKLRWGKEPEGQLLRSLLVTPPESVDVSDFKKAFKRLSLSSVEIKRVLHKLHSLPQLSAWQAKLSQVEKLS
jgi:hypothetical protein